MELSYCGPNEVFPRDFDIFGKQTLCPGPSQFLEEPRICKSNEEKWPVRLFQFPCSLSQPIPHIA